MRQHKGDIVALILLGALSAKCHAQPSSSMPGSFAERENQTFVALGQSTAQLYGPWQFKVGDSPIDQKTGQPLWAAPEFDDSQWEKVDLTPTTGLVDPLTGQRGFVPGWTLKGHPGYWGYAWYRLRVTVQSSGEELALAGPANVDDFYQVFADGNLLGEFGDFSKRTPTGYYTRPMMFPLHKEADSRKRGEAQTASHVFAFRVFMLPSTLTEVADTGGIHTAPVLGNISTIAAKYQMDWLELVRGYAMTVAQIPLLAVVALMAFTLILFDRSDPVYLWIGGLYLLQVAASAASSAGTFTQLISIRENQFIDLGLLTSLIYAGWTMVWWVWFGRQRPTWTPLAAAGLGLLYLLTIVVGQEMIVALVPHRIAEAVLTGSAFVRLAFLILQLWIVGLGIRRHGFEGWIVLPAVILWGIRSFGPELVLLHIPTRWEAGGFSVRLAHVSNLLLAIVVAVLLLRRLLKSIQSQRQMALDIKQAQEVQQVILPESRTELPGLVVESEYRPAREVGGDFFQVIPHQSDGSLLIVAGDVTGKGLKAGMLVALLVGAVRSTAELRLEPEFLLQALNRRLIGRSDAQATCLALRIDSDGTATLANAGHMAPYLNGEPMPMGGALPLGMLEGAEFSVMRFKMNVHDKLVLISDGIVEATDADGSLFGFERVHELLRADTSATELADAAQLFGQEDDISVISVTRTVVPERASVSLQKQASIPSLRHS